MAGQRAIPKYGLDLVDSNRVQSGILSGLDDVDPTTPAGQTDVEHGTHVAGIIAARNNAQGITGVAPHATLIPIRLLNDKGRGVRNAWYDLNIAIEHSDATGAFVMNNSWGPKFQSDILDIEVEGKTRYFVGPRVAIAGRSYANWPESDSVFQQRVVRTVILANRDDRNEVESGGPKPGLLLVFAAGNEGFNAETGLVPVFENKDDATKYKEDGDEEKAEYIRSTAPELNGLLRKPNLPDPMSAAFLKHTDLKGYWLSVVATNRANRIVNGSNGCGEAASYCMAAPGHRIRSTVPDGGYKFFSGTSMAAPMVSGAAAVLKQVYPDQSAKDISTILLCTATDLDKSTGRPTKSIEECADKGPAATQANGWAPSEVYGHGLLNLARALQPIGPTRAAAADAFGVAAASDTRVAFSSAFGDAAPSQAMDFGGFDMFGRVYRFRAPLQDRVMPGPRLAGVMAMSSPTKPIVMGRGDGVTTLLRRSTDADSAIGEAGVISYVGARSRTDLALVNRRTGAALSPAALLRQGDDAPPVWDSLAPQARDIIGTRSDWRMASNLHAGVFFSRANVAAATRRGGSYSVRDYGVSSRIGSRISFVEARLDRMNESGRFLGSRPEGGHALARPTRSDYLRLRASYRLASGLSVGAEWLRLRARVDFRHDGFVRDMALAARAAGVHLATADLARDGDRLVLHYGEPLAVTGGVMRQTSITGYTSSGAYRATTRDLDLAVRKRHRMAQMVYQRPLGRATGAGRVSGFVAAAHHRNWSHQGGLTNDLVMLGLSLQH